MFEHAMQPAIDSGRRYSAEDFRSLIARLSTGPTSKAKRQGPSASAITLPRLVAWELPPMPPLEVVQMQAQRPPAPDAPADAKAPGANEWRITAAEAPEVTRMNGGPAHDDLTTQDLLPDLADEPQVPSVSTAEAGAAVHEPVIEPEAEPAVEVAGPETTGPEMAVDPELQSAETARTLLDIMAMPTGVQPQERALAGDTLLRLVSRMPVASLVSLCDRLCIMDAPPPLLVRRLIGHENLAVAGPLLERCPGISDQDLMEMVNTGDFGILRLIARRRQLSPALTDALIRHGDASVTIAVVRNPGAALSHEAFNMLAEAAKTRPSLQAPLATRADTPAPIAFELFWILPPQLRRYVLSRFLTESANLDRILKIAQTLDEPQSEGAGTARIADKAECEALIGLIAEGKASEAAQKLAGLAGISEANARRIIADPEGEPLTVAMKAMGMSRTQAAAAAETLRDAPEAPLRCNRRTAELQNLFDSLSFTKARVLLTYWDWAVEKSGPYSARSV